jgi:hypothetical protein
MRTDILAMVLVRAATFRAVVTLRPSRDAHSDFGEDAVGDALGRAGKGPGCGQPGAPNQDAGGEGRPYLDLGGQAGA